jgi:GTP-binding protein
MAVARNGKISKIFTSLGLKRVETEMAEAGDIVTIAGIADIYVGETISSSPDATTDASDHWSMQPTLKMEFGVNTSPFAGKEGKFVTSRQIRDRLERETRDERRTQDRLRQLWW